MTLTLVGLVSDPNFPLPFPLPLFSSVTKLRRTLSGTDDAVYSNSYSTVFSTNTYKYRLPPLNF